MHLITRTAGVGHSAVLNNNHGWIEGKWGGGWIAQSKSLKNRVPVSDLELSPCSRSIAPSDRIGSSWLIVIFSTSSLLKYHLLNSQSEISMRTPSISLSGDFGVVFRTIGPAAERRPAVPGTHLDFTNYTFHLEKTYLVHLRVFIRLNTTQKWNNSQDCCDPTNLKLQILVKKW